MEEVEEEPFVEVRAENGGVMATPFFSQDNGTTLIRCVAWWIGVGDACFFYDAMFSNS